MSPSAFPRIGWDTEARSLSALRPEQSGPANPTVGFTTPMFIMSNP